MFMYNGTAWFVRERNGSYWLIDDAQPELELRLPGVFSAATAERMAWLLVSGS